MLCSIIVRALYRCISVQFQLTNVFRQSDGEFIAMLNEIRVANLLRSSPSLSSHQVGKCSDATYLALTARLGATLPQDEYGIRPTTLRTTNVDVKDENEGRLRELPGDAHVYTAVDTGGKDFIDALNRMCPAPLVLTLKVGAQVMLNKNLPQLNKQFVNGSISLFACHHVTQRIHCIAILVCSRWDVGKIYFTNYFPYQSDNPDNINHPKHTTIITRLAGCGRTLLQPGLFFYLLIKSTSNLFITQ
jgi:hypothetical protein